MGVVFWFETVRLELPEEGACVRGELLLELSGRRESIFLGLLCGMAWALPFRGFEGVLMAYSFSACLLVLPLRVFFSCSAFLPFIFRKYNRTFKLQPSIITSIHHNTTILYYYFNR
jgi:hypothetical protein